MADNAMHLPPALDPAARPDVEAIRKRVEAATPGPWTWHEVARHLVTGVSVGELVTPDDRVVIQQAPDWNHMLDMLPSDADFLGHVRDDVPALLAEVERLRAALKQIADRPDAEMEHARTLHYDMRGWALLALRGGGGESEPT